MFDWAKFFEVERDLGGLSGVWVFRGTRPSISALAYPSPKRKLP